MQVMTAEDDTVRAVLRKFCEHLLRLIAPSPKPARSSVTWADPTSEVGYREVVSREAGR